MSANSLFGWNLLHSSVADAVKCKEDTLLCFTHLVLISNGFECIGLGDSKNMDGNEPKSETLPTGWNAAYKLRYIFQGKLYLLQGTKLDDGIMINLIRTDERNVAMVQLNSRTVVQDTGNLDQMIPTNKDMVKMVKEQLIQKVTSSTKTKEVTSQTPTERKRSSELQYVRSDQSFPVPLHGWDPDPRGMFDPRHDLGGVGYNDLNPLAGIGGPRIGGIPGGIGPLGPGGGGMLFQPPNRRDPQFGIPGGSVPPGARFDPFRPPEVDRYRPPRRPNNPDNDEMLPPGFDDMFS